MSLDLGILQNKKKSSAKNKSIPKSLERHGESYKHKEAIKEEVKQPFTEIPRYLIESLFSPDGMSASHPEKQRKPENYTDLNEAAVKQQLEANFEDQEDSPQKLADARRFLQRVQEEQKQAQLYFKEKDKEREKEEEEERLKKEEEERIQRQQAAQAEEPTSKQKRGLLFGTKKKKKEINPETRVSFGKN